MYEKKLPEPSNQAKAQIAPRPSARFSYEFYSLTPKAWGAMHEAIAQAKKSIFWEVFIFVDDAIGTPFMEALSAKARAGVEVKMVVDAVGSFSFSRQAEEQLRSAGVDVRRFNRLYPEFSLKSWANRLLHRNHRKVLIVDETTAFLGGVNIEAKSEKWNDVYLKIAGTRPLWPLLRGFAKSYISAGGARKNVRHLLHPKLRKGWELWKDRFRFILHTPSGRAGHKISRLYLEALSSAKASVNLLTPYYVPDRQFMRALVAARKRGVRVRIFLPIRLDFRFMELVSRVYLALTKATGTEVYLLPNMHHGKALSVDDSLGMVGSMNVTRRSFFLDQESGVTFSQEDMVRDLNALFNEWHSGAEPLTDAYTRPGSWRDRFTTWWARRFERFL